jgi:hypothetical protein
MDESGSRPGLADSALLWFALAAAASVASVVLGRMAGTTMAGPDRLAGPVHPVILLLTSGATIVLAGLATWRLVRVRADAWLLPLAAVNLVLLEPGRAGNPFTWRVEWGVFGVMWTAAAVLLFARLLRRTDELQRRIQLEGAAIGLALALPAAMVYALFEPLCPPLRAQWVTIALLLFWWSGWMMAARRYR